MDQFKGFEVIFIGDIHGHIDPIIRNLTSFDLSEQNLIQVGDFGLGFDNLKKDLKVMNLLDTTLQASNTKLYIVRGNHDNPSFWDTEGFSNIILCKDYSVHEIDNQKVLFIGGGVSIDRKARRTNFTWWPDEVIKRDINFLKNFNDTISTVVTHVPVIQHFDHLLDPKFLKRWTDSDLLLSKDLSIERNIMAEIETKILSLGTVHTWASGHIHKSAKFYNNGINYISLGIDEWKEV